MPVDVAKKAASKEAAVPSAHSFAFSSSCERPAAMTSDVTSHGMPSSSRTSFTSTVDKKVDGRSISAGAEPDWLSAAKSKDVATLRQSDVGGRRCFDCLLVSMLVSMRG